MNCFKEEKFGLRDQCTFVGDEMEVYIPTSYLDKNSKMASMVGEFVQTMGIFLYTYKGDVFRVLLPVHVKIGFSEQRKWTGKLKPEMPNIEYQVFKLKHGDPFIYDLNHKRDVDDLSYIFRSLIENGKIPEILTYDEAAQFIMQALAVTQVNGRLGVSNLTYELIISELYRNKKNYNESFRFELNRNPNNPYAYKMVKIQKVPELSNIFNGITGEDKNQQVLSAVYKTRAGIPDKESPIEKTLRY